MSYVPGWAWAYRCRLCGYQAYSVYGVQRVCVLCGRPMDYAGYQMPGAPLQVVIHGN